MSELKAWIAVLLSLPQHMSVAPFSPIIFKLYVFGLTSGTSLFLRSTNAIVGTNLIHACVVSQELVLDPPFQFKRFQSWLVSGCFDVINHRAT